MNRNTVAIRRIKGGYVIRAAFPYGDYIDDHMSILLTLEEVQKFLVEYYK